MEDTNTKIGAFWSTVNNDNNQSDAVKHWWQNNLIRKHINGLLSKDPTAELSDGLNQKLINNYSALLPFKLGVSVGGGIGRKEAQLILKGIVGSFEIFELSEGRIEEGRKLARKLKISDRLRFIHGNAFSLVDREGVYDFVHWNNSLHHMMNTKAAIKWSHKILKKGGVFYMDDFVGANRFQWPEVQLELANRVRSTLEGTKYLQNPDDTSKYLPIRVNRHDPQKLAADDPSEAADSERIIEQIEDIFPNAEITRTGGIVYHLALKGAIGNFSNKDDHIVLELLLLIDELCAKLGHTHYATALATKE